MAVQVTDISAGGLGAVVAGGEPIAPGPRRLQVRGAAIAPVNVGAVLAWDAHAGRCGFATREAIVCGVCEHPTSVFDASQRTPVASNVRRFRHERFHVWRCAHCGSLHSQEDVDLDHYYDDYPMQHQRVDAITRVAHRVRLRRLVKSGLERHHTVLDYGCGAGHFIAHLHAKGYAHAAGYDRFVERFSDPSVLERRYDFVLSQDVLEHVPDPAAFLAELASLVQPGGVLCIGTPDASRVDLDSPVDHDSTLHQPYHRHILSREALLWLGSRLGLRPARLYDRWYYSSLMPGCNGPFINAYMAAIGDIDASFGPARPGLVLRSPKLLALYFFGNFVRDSQITVMFRQAPEAR